MTIDELRGHNVEVIRDGHGGGEWLLTAMLGLADLDRGEERLEWIAAHAMFLTLERELHS